MSAAGSPPRVRVKATTSATVELSLPERRSSHSASGLGLSAPYSVSLVRDLPKHRHERVVLEVAPDARQLVADLHASRPQLLGRADPGQQQQLRRADRAGSTGAPRARRARAPRRRGPCAGARRRRARRLELDAQHRRRSVRTSRLGRVQRRAQVGVGGAEAAAVLLRHLEHRRAVLLGAVVVGDARDARRPRWRRAGAGSAVAASAAR